MAGSSLAQKQKETNNPIIGTWKYTNHSIKNDFQQVLSATSRKDYENEYFIFASNNKFRHEFVDRDGNVVKVLHGKWKTFGEKINIDYSDIDYTVNSGYFFIDKDLVLGQNFNHVIFTKNEFDERNIAQK